MDEAPAVTTTTRALVDSGPCPSSNCRPASCAWRFPCILSRGLLADEEAGRVRGPRASHCACLEMRDEFLRETFTFVDATRA